MHSSSLAHARTKDEFLNQAHEARLARELARRHNDSAIIIQSHVRRFLACRGLKNSLPGLSVLKAAYDTNDSVKLIQTIRRILFIGKLTNDRVLVEPLLQFIHEMYYSFDSREAGGNFMTRLMPFASKDERSFEICCQTFLKLIDICCQFINSQTINEGLSKQSCLSETVVFINILNMLAIKDHSTLSTALNATRIDETVEGRNLQDTHERLLRELSTRTVKMRWGVFLRLSDSIARVIKGPRTDMKVQLLSAYIGLAIDIFRAQQYGDKSPNNCTVDDQVHFLVRLLTVPALIYHLERFSTESLAAIKENAIFEKCVDMMSRHNQQLQTLSSTPALCLVANLVHLASMTEDKPCIDVIPFVTTLTKLLECCQKDMKQNKIPAETTGGAQKDVKKANEATDESYNHILGWLIRESAHAIDQATSELIKCQLGHLWSVRMLKILLNDLIKANETRKSSVLDAKTRSPKTKTPGCELTRRTSQDERKCDLENQNATIISIKRVVERAAHTMSKSIGYSYTKTTNLSSSNYTSSKLMTEEARRVALVCLMLNSALKALRMIKQDILIGLCFHDYILNNLWDYISSLSPNNGLKAFLDHLIINSKSNIPEFHILMLFCECTSHIIGILDDSELYEQQKPFTLDELVTMSSFLNIFVFRLLNNQLVSYKAGDMDPMLKSTHKLLTDLYKRDCRRTFAPDGHWLIKELKMALFLKDLDAGKPVAQAILNLLPHIIPHKERVLIFRRLVARDRSACYSTFITIHRSRIVEDGYQQLARLPSTALKGLIRVKFINDHGLDEAGIDQDGVFKEFLEDTIKRVFDPSLNLFCTTSEQRLYPSPTSRLHEDHLSLFSFVGKMLGKAVYEGIVVDVPFATFFLARVLGQHHSQLYSPIDDLASLDPELYKNLIYIRHHDVSDLDLTFSIDQDIMGKIENFELEPGGRHVPVTNQNRVRYIHSVANFRMRVQIEEQTKAFIKGFKSIVNLEWLHMFSASEFQRLISGDTAPIDLQDLRRHTKYFGGFHNNHRVVCWLWDILESDFTPEEHSLFLKFVTSCSKPPLLGFENLEPPFSIRCVEVSDDQDLGDTVGSVLRGFFAIRRSDPVDRLPTSSTCFNLLKLPNYQRRSTLREKLRYAIRSSTGFELS